MPLRIALIVVALSQFILGLLTLIIPLPFLGMMGLTVPPADTGYMLAMLGARFIASGIGLVWLARQAQPDTFWVRNMVLIQVMDFASGVWFWLSGTVALQTVAFPMFNAALFAASLGYLSRSRPALAKA